MPVLPPASKSAPPAPPPISAPNAYLYDGRGNLLYSKSGDKVLTGWGSVRKILAAVLVWEEKQDVLDTEYVTLTAADIQTTGPEFRSGLVDGDQVTWRDLLRLMLVPSMSDMAAIVTRVLGEELRQKYGIGETAQQAMGYWMGQVAVKAGAPNVLCFTNTSTNQGPVQGEILPENFYASCHSLARILEYVLTYPGLAAIIQSQCVSVTAASGTVTHNTVDRLRLAWDSSDTPTGHAFDGYIGGKTGDATWGNQVFACEMPSGDVVYGALYRSTTRALRVRDIIRLLMAAENHHPHLRACEAHPDPFAADVEFRLLGEPADSGPLARSVTASGVPVISSDYMAGIAMEFGSGAVTIDGAAPALGADDFTLEIYLRGTGSSGTTSFLAGQWRAVSGGRGWMLQLDGNQVQFLYSVDGNSNVTVSQTVDRNHLLNGAPTVITVQRQGGGLVLFVNGIPSPVHSIGTASVYLPETPVMVGARQSSGSGLERHFTGLIDEVTLTSAARYDAAGYRPRYRPARWD